jgi:hypothetical protein
MWKILAKYGVAEVLANVIAKMYTDNEVSTSVPRKSKGKLSIDLRSEARR